MSVNLVLVRVDCRLIHGQVIEAWVPHLKADCLVVAHDETAEDPVQKSILSMSVPPHVEVCIQPLREAVHTLCDGRFQGRRVILLLASIDDAFFCYRAGLHFTHLNLGNLHCTTGKTRVSSYLSLDDRDVDHLRRLKDEGVVVEARPVPRSPSCGLGELVRQFPAVTGSA